MRAAPSLLRIPTTWGVIEVQASAGKIVSCTLPRCESTPSRAFKVDGRSRLDAGQEDRGVLRQAEKFVVAALQGRAAACPPLHDAEGGPFGRRARQHLRRVPRGRTCTYGELAKAAGSPRAARAAGTACGGNPLPLFIPCHRVLAAGGKLGGFSSGLAWKKLLLEREGSS
jgi:methylated-DNA-[protein]-cysteine S-methyltransferase